MYLYVVSIDRTRLIIQQLHLFLDTYIFIVNPKYYNESNIACSYYTLHFKVFEYF